MTKKDIEEFQGFCRNATDKQLQGIYDKEKAARRIGFARLAQAEAYHRGITLDD